MTLDQITYELAAKHKDWSSAWTEELDRVSGDPAIARRITELIEASAADPRTRTGRLRSTVMQTLSLSNAANFRFGLLIGFLLRTESCLACDATGEVCRCCSRPEDSCACLEDYHAIVCPACHGHGDLR